MFSFKSITLSLLTLSLGFFALTSHPVVAGQGPARSINIHYTTQEELQRMRPLAQPRPLSIEKRTAIAQALRMPELCPAVTIGTVTATVGDQTCTYEVTQLQCSYGNRAQVTIQECTINQ